MMGILLVLTAQEHYVCEKMSIFAREIVLRLII